MTNSWAMLQEEMEAMRDRGRDVSGAIEYFQALSEYGEYEEVVLTDDTKTQSQLDIISKCDAVKSLLLEKNAAYGDSALEPVRIFSKATPVEQILVRLDDKLSRISRGGGIVGDDEDVIQDLIGYLILLQIALDRT